MRKFFATCFLFLSPVLAIFFQLIRFRTRCILDLLSILFFSHNKVRTARALFFLSFIVLSTPTLYSQEWIRIDPGIDSTSYYNFYTSSFINKDLGWTAGNNSVFQTTNGGLKWKTISNFDEGIIFTDIDFVDRSNGWLVGQIWSAREYVYYKTTDGGRIWNQIAAPEFFLIDFYDSLNGFGSVEWYRYKTSDGGYSWNKCIDTGDHISRTISIYFVNEMEFWAVGASGQSTDSGIILKSTDGGQSWFVIEDMTGVIGFKITFTDSLNGYIAGYNYFTGSVIQKTTDGGKTWDYQYLQGTGLTDLAFVSPDTGWAVGYDGQLWKTIDAGTTWTRIETETKADLRKIYLFENNNIGYILGDSSVIFKYDRLNDVIENPEIPLYYKLYQNHPNPFNPSTLIKYALPHDGFVSLKVYDILGNEVASLVDEVKPAGNYTAEFNGYNLASGVYIYRLKVQSPQGGFISSKKMVLTK